MWLVSPCSVGHEDWDWGPWREWSRSLAVGGPNALRQLSGGSLQVGTEPAFCSGCRAASCFLPTASLELCSNPMGLFQHPADTLPGLGWLSRPLPPFLVQAPALDVTCLLPGEQSEETFPSTSPLPALPGALGPLRVLSSSGLGNGYPGKVTEMLCAATHLSCPPAKSRLTSSMPRENKQWLYHSTDLR